MGQNIIEEPQLNYLLELFSELGSMADNFVLVGAQAMRFMINQPRTTKDFDFVLDVIALRGMSQSVDEVLKKLHYEVVPEARRFQFTKQIPNSPQKIRIEFLACEKERRPKNFRVDVQKHIHARACIGAEIVLRESNYQLIKGLLPNGKYTEVKLRVVHPHALLMMKLLAMDDRYKNIRGPLEVKYDRNEARVHAADITAIVHNHIQNSDFPKLFWSQFYEDNELKMRSKDIITNYFWGLDSPGIRLYAEFLQLQNMVVEEAELKRVVREVRFLLHHLAD